jgi:K(+)-stimulated pyrophosphate-energized sodium pump
VPTSARPRRRPSRSAAASTSPSSRARSRACWSPVSRSWASPLLRLSHPHGRLSPSSREVIDSLVALGFGASLISIFARLGGGIFTKGADVGGDLVGKVEAGIPEDDPRNPATIADNVGDNVGDCAGMAADLFETYAVTIVATMVLAAIFFAGQPRRLETMLLYPARHRRGLHRDLDHRHLLRQARPEPVDHGRPLQGPHRTGVLSLVAIALVNFCCSAASHGLPHAPGRGVHLRRLFWCAVVGLGVTALIVVITEYYTGVGYRPVRSIAQARSPATAPT